MAKILVISLFFTVFEALAQPELIDTTVSYEEYAKLSLVKQQAYDREIRAAFAEFEISTQDKMIFANHPKWIDFALFPEAFAGSNKFCLVGGVERSLIPSGNRELCPTYGRPCGSFGAAGFLCGTIYNEACVSREPLSSITDRCFQAASGAPLNSERYEQRRSVIQSVAADCRSSAIDDRYKPQCEKFLQRMNHNNAMAQAALKSTAAATKPVQEPPAAPLPTPAPQAIRTSATEDVAPTPTPTPNAPSPAPVLPPKAQPNEPANPQQPTAPLPPKKTPPPANPVPAEARREQAAPDCLSKNRARLGPLACVACGLENVAPADIRNHGGGVSKWISLLGAMAQRHYGPYRVNDEISRRAYQQRVSEMVASYGYCTDNEYPISLPDNSRAYIDGQSLRGRDELKFAQSFGLMSTIKGLFTGDVENQHAPMMYADRIFDDSDRNSGWETGNVQNRQWRFRSMNMAFRNSYQKAPYTKCANAIENRLSTSNNFRMCPIREGKWSNGVSRRLYPPYVTESEMAGNQRLYESMASACGFAKTRKMPSRLCDHACWGTYRTFRQAGSHLPNCDDGGLETYTQFVNNNGKGSEPGKGRGIEGKGNEPQVGRGAYGSDHGNSIGSGGGDPGSSSSSSAGDNGGKGSEGGSGSGR